MIHKLCAEDLMNKDMLTVADTMTVHELASFFTDKMISGAPVTNDNGQLIGVVSMSDIVRNDGRRHQIVEENEPNDYLADWQNKFNEDEISDLHIEEADDLIVRDIMTKLVFKVSSNTPIAEIADIMLGGRIHRLIVTDDERPVGIITSMDLLRAVRDHAN